MIDIGVICLLFWAGAPGPASPRIERLRVEAAKDPSAEERFWEEIGRRGAPLIEPPGEPGKSLVTFVYRGGPDTRTVVVLGDGTPGAPSDNQLTAVPGTRVWQRTYVYRSDARFRYSLSPNDDLRPMESVPPAEFAKRMATFIADPLNPRRAEGPVPMSDLSLPDAPPQPYLEGAPPPVEKRAFGDLTIHLYRPRERDRSPAAAGAVRWQLVCDFHAGAYHGGESRAARTDPPRDARHDRKRSGKAQRRPDLQ